MLSPYARGAATTSSLATKLNISDTSSMLSPYARGAATTSSLATKLNISDTATMLSNRFAKDTVSLSARINSSKQAIIDTATNIRNTINASSGVTAGTYGSTTSVPVITVDTRGRVTSLTTSTIAATLLEETVEYASVTDGQTSFTLSHTPSSNTLVRIFVNGVLISQTAHSRVGTAVTYIPANNGAYSLTAGDRVQLYYYY